MALRSYLTPFSIALVVLGGCSSSPTQETTPAGNPSGALARTAQTQPVTAPVVQETDAQKLGRLLKGVEGRSVYFDYDDFTINTRYRHVLEAHADVLTKSSRSTVVIEGNADERGSREYNLALGQKRAESVAKALKTLGIPSDRVESISFGKEKPRAACHEEKCWAENRRVDFTYKLK